MIKKIGVFLGAVGLFSFIGCHRRMRVVTYINTQGIPAQSSKNGDILEWKLAPNDTNVDHFDINFPGTDPCGGTGSYVGNHTYRGKPGVAAWCTVTGNTPGDSPSRYSYNVKITATLNTAPTPIAPTGSGTKDKAEQPPGILQAHQCPQCGTVGGASTSSGSESQMNWWMPSGTPSSGSGPTLTTTPTPANLTFSCVNGAGTVSNVPPTMPPNPRSDAQPSPGGLISWEMDTPSGDNWIVNFLSGSSPCVDKNGASVLVIQSKGGPYSCHTAAGATVGAQFPYTVKIVNPSGAVDCTIPDPNNADDHAPKVVIVAPPTTPAAP